MRQDAVAVVNEAQAVFRNSAAHLDVLLLDLHCLLAQQTDNLLHRPAEVRRHNALHSGEGPAQVDRRGARGVQIFFIFTELRQELLRILRADLLRQHKHPIPRADTDRRGAAHTQLENCFVDLLRRLKRDHFGNVRQERLIDDKYL